MGLREAMAMSAQYGQQKPLGPDIAAPPMPQQLPMLGAPQQGGGNQMMNMGSKLLGQYLKQRGGPGQTPQGGMSGMEGLGGDAANNPMEMPALWAGGRAYPGVPTLMGELGPEDVVGDDGQQQVVGQNGPQVVVPQTPATVIPNPRTSSPYQPYGWMDNDPAPTPAQAPSAVPVRLPDAVRARWAGGQPATPESSGITGDTSATRPRVANPADYLRTKIAEDTLAKPVDHNGRLKSGLLSAALGALQGAGNGGGWRGALGGAVGGGVAGAVNPAYDEQQMQQYQTQGDQRDLQQLDANQQAGLAGQMKRAQIAGQYGNIGYKGGMLDVAKQKADTGDQRADAGDRRVDIADRNATTNEGKGKAYATKVEAETALKERRIREPHSKTVQDPQTGKYYVINTDRETGVATASGINAEGGGQFSTTAPHTVRMDEINQRAAAAAAKAASAGKTKAEQTQAANSIKAGAFSEAAKGYDSMEKDAADRGDYKGAAAAKAKAIAARRAAAGFGGQ